MAAKKKKPGKKTRTEFRKRYDKRRRNNDLTRAFEGDELDLDQLAQGERVSGKGDLTRKRTIQGELTDTEDGGYQVELDIDASLCEVGRVLRVHGLTSIVRCGDGQERECTVRGLLKSLATDLQHIVIAGDIVTVQRTSAEQGVIVRVEPRRNELSRTSRKRRQILCANVDLVVVVASVAEPQLKPNLVDRFIVSAEKSGLKTAIVINKVDLAEAADLQPLVGVWSQMGYPVVLTSATTGFGIDRLRELVRGRDSVVSGQSGVGKSSLLNAIEPGLGLRVSHVSEENQKGRHTTTTAQLIPLQEGGHLIDTPGIRQFQLWDVIPEEVAGFFRDLRPFVNHCRFPDCTHTHEEACGVKWAVADGYLDVRRYESYCQMVLDG